MRIWSRTVWRRGQCRKGPRLLLRATLAFVAVLLLVSPVLGAQPAMELPEGFVALPIAHVFGSPTDLTWNGPDLLVSTQEGWIYRLPNGEPTEYPQLMLDVSDRVGKGPEQGLLGVVVDPQFPDMPYVYIYYTRARESGHCDTLPANCTNRVSRFTMQDDGTLDPTSEVVLLDTLLVGTLHNAGDLAFGPDGYLYVSTGDAGYWNNAQNLSNLNGKILRIDREGAPAPGNPFAEPSGIRCDEVEPPGLGMPCAEIYAFGLRNPFRITFDPASPESRFMINDVGHQSWEEIDLGGIGHNYGWPIREGPCPTGYNDDCAPNPAFIEPIYAYSHETGCLAATGGAFVPETGAWGAHWAGTYLFADWGCGKIFTLTQEPDGAYTATPIVGGLQTITPILMDPAGERLFYGREGGDVSVIQPAKASATPEATPLATPIA